VRRKEATRIPSQSHSVAFLTKTEQQVYMFSVEMRGLWTGLSARSGVAELTLLLMLRRWDMNGLMSRYSGNAMNDEIFLWNRLECSKRCVELNLRG
jgi:hypothetical protein